MTVFNIPDVYKHGFELFLNLNQETKSNLINGIETAPKGLLPEELSKMLSNKLNLSEIDLEEITSMIFSLHKAKEKSGFELNEFAEGIIEALKQSKDPKYKIDEDTYNHLIQILNISGSLLITLKTIDLYRHRERIVTDSKIITDIRPIFDEHAEIIGSTVIHNLKIEFEETSGHKELYFAVDKDDLKSLKENIKRAELKEKAIKIKYSSFEDDFIEL